MARSTYPTTPIPHYVYTSGQSYKTLISTFDGGQESRRRLQRFPLRNFALDYRLLSLANRDTLHDFYHARFGAYEDFWYVDFPSRAWTDEYVGVGYSEALTGARMSDNGAYTDETTDINDAGANDVALLPAVPVAAQDGFLFGFSTTELYQETVCDTLCLNVGTAGVADTLTITWKYWTGAWTALAGVVDDTNSFKVAGTNYVTWTHPTDWIATTIDGTEAYWVYADLTAYVAGGGPVQPLATQAWQQLRTYSLHGVDVTGTPIIYKNGVAQVGGGVDYTFYDTGTGYGGADTIVFNHGELAQGDLITSDIDAKLRVAARFKGDEFPENIPAKNLYNIQLEIQEVRES